ncbi:MAG TPA: phosphatase domain-containing protein [Methylomirabilota bacterium]|nr:phosphatase domain-containing protein [Methylomirabilota bacterium]
MIDVGARLGRGITRGRVRLRALLGLRREPRIVAFRGYGSRHRVRVKGRVEERSRRPMTDEPGSRWRVVRESWQRDPEIYAEVVREHPGRVAALYLRCIRPDAERRRQLERLGDEVADAGSELVAADHTTAMAEHAAARGFIAPDAVDGISARCRRSWR